MLVEFKGNAGIYLQLIRKKIKGISGIFSWVPRPKFYLTFLIVTPTFSGIGVLILHWGIWALT